MNRDQYAAAVTPLLTAHRRRLEEDPARFMPELVDELWKVADQHAADTGVIAVRREDDAPSPEQVATWIREHPDAWHAELRKLVRLGVVTLPAAERAPAPRRRPGGKAAT